MEGIRGGGTPPSHSFYPFFQDLLPTISTCKCPNHEEFACGSGGPPCLKTCNDLSPCTQGFTTDPTWPQLPCSLCAKCHTFSSRWSLGTNPHMDGILSTRRIQWCHGIRLTRAGCWGRGQHTCQAALLAALGTVGTIGMPTNLRKSVSNKALRHRALLHT